MSKSGVEVYELGMVKTKKGRSKKRRLSGAPANRNRLTKDMMKDLKQKKHQPGGPGMIVK